MIQEVFALLFLVTIMKSCFKGVFRCYYHLWRGSVSLKTWLLYSKKGTKEEIMTKFAIKMFITFNKLVSLSYSSQVKDSVQNMAAWFNFKNSFSWLYRAIFSKSNLPSIKMKTPVGQEIEHKSEMAQHKKDAPCMTARRHKFSLQKLTVPSQKHQSLQWNTIL